MNHITPKELKIWMEEQQRFILIDVREGVEREAFHIGGVHIPVGEIMERRAELKHEEPVVVYCEKGIRSAIVIQRLEALGYTNLYNLSGGMSAWKLLL